MFQTRQTRSTLGSTFVTFELIYHGAVRHVRKMHGNPVMSIFMNMLQTIMFVAVFYLMFSVMGMRGIAVRGDFMIYIMTGIFLYLTHTKALGAVVGSEGPASPMMQHAPMNTFIAICGGLLSVLYVQVLSAAVLIYIYHALVSPVEFYDLAGCFMMLMLAWFTGAAIGMVFLAMKPWAPTPVSVLSTVYQRANMIASGKMFLANSLPSAMLVMFDWNPLFHAIDQSRGFAFVNYFPRNSTVEYPLTVGIVLLCIGLMGEFFTRKHASASWNARR